MRQSSGNTMPSHIHTDLAELDLKTISFTGKNQKKKVAGIRSANGESELAKKSLCSGIKQDIPCQTGRVNNAQNIADDTNRFFQSPGLALP